jgi:hypothetical protein
VFLIRRGAAREAEIEALARYVDGRALDEDAATLREPLRRTADAVRSDLRASQPSAEFVDTLRLRLIAAADQRGPVEEHAAAWRQPRYLALGAAGLVSAAAVIAFVARSRAQAAQARQAA